jgi:predicted nuclease of predicted toxin-antitoxin system
MKILLDECLPLDFRHSFPNHDAHTGQWAGLKSKQNRELLPAAEAAGYDVLLTVDQGLPHQQSPFGRKLSIILIRFPELISSKTRYPWWMRSSRRWKAFSPARPFPFHRQTDPPDQQSISAASP